MTTHLHSFESRFPRAGCIHVSEAQGRAWGVARVCPLSALPVPLTAATMNVACEHIIDQSRARYADAITFDAAAAADDDDDDDDD